MTTEARVGNTSVEIRVAKRWDHGIEAFRYSAATFVGVTLVSFEGPSIAHALHQLAQMLDSVESTVGDYTEGATVVE